MKQLVVLRRQPWRENDWLLDVFCATAGRQTLVCSARLMPDYYCVYEADRSSAHDWPRLTVLRPIEHWPLCHEYWICAAYVNELLLRFLPEREPLPVLWQQYQHTLQAFAAQQYPAPWLRLFETCLLQQMGYGVAWQQDAFGQPIDASAYYVMDVQQGWRLAQEQESGYLGQWLLEWASGDSRSPHIWRMARDVLRTIIDARLDRPLVSRDFFV